MIIPYSEPQRACDACGYPLDTAHLEWRLAHPLVLHLHASCAQALQKGLKRNVHWFYYGNQPANSAASIDR